MNSSNIRSENKLQVNTEIQKLKEENSMLKKFIFKKNRKKILSIKLFRKCAKVDELEKLVDYFKNEKSKNEDLNSSSSTTSSIKRVFLI